MIAIYKKEMKTYFTTMVGYVFLGILIGFAALMFTIINVDARSASFAQTIDNMAIVFLILIPMLTMRLFAEEARQKTDQLIFTSPISIFQIVFGKFLAAVSLFLIGMAATVIFPLMLKSYGPVPFAETVGVYVGYILMGICFIAVGLFISCMTESQSIAAIATFAVLFIMFVLQGITMPSDRTSSLVFVIAAVCALSYFMYHNTKNKLAGLATGIFLMILAMIAFIIDNTIFDAIIPKCAEWFFILSRFSYFVYGILDYTSVLYYITFAIAFVYLTINMIEKRRWR